MDSFDWMKIGAVQDESSILFFCLTKKFEGTDKHVYGFKGIVHLKKKICHLHLIQNLTLL